MQCMKFLRSNLQKLTQNFNTISSILKNPKIFQKPQILVFKTWNTCKWRRSEAYQVKKDLKKLENPKGRGLEWVREVWEMKSQRYRERDRQKWAANHTRRIYKPSVNLDRWGVETTVEQVSRKSNFDRSCVEKLSRKKNTRSKIWCSIDPPGVGQLSRG